MGHIPAGASQEQTILTFREALISTTPEVRDYSPDDWLYVPDHYAEYRYMLGTRGEHPLICIGINPSTARPGALDNTLKSVERIAKANGFDSFIMFNVYAQRATIPDDMDRELNEFLHRENMEAFSYALEQEKSGSPAVWAAWGTIIEKRPWLWACLKEMIQRGQELDTRWFSAGAKSKSGHPHHPLYLRKDSRLESFDVLSYVSAGISNSAN